MRFVDSLDIHASTKQIRAPPLNGSSAIWRFKHSNAIEVHDGITFDFYTGLPHMVQFSNTSFVHVSKHCLYYACVEVNKHDIYN